MKLSTLIKYLRRMPYKVNSYALPTFRSEIPIIFKALKERAPRDTGQYQDSWKIRDMGVSNPVLADVVFYNDHDRAALFEFGANTNSAPWYYPGTKAKRFKKGRSDKLTVALGKVWAGGEKPGHHMTIGGAIDPVIYRNKKKQDEIMQRIVKSISRGL